MLPILELIGSYGRAVMPNLHSTWYRERFVILAPKVDSAVIADTRRGSVRLRYLLARPSITVRPLARELSHSAIMPRGIAGGLSPSDNIMRSNIYLRN